MSATFSTSMVVSPGEGVSTRLEAWAWDQSKYDPASEPSLNVTIRIDGMRLSIQGPVADMLALVDRIRDAVVAEVGRAWPVESAHDGALDEFLGMVVNDCVEGR